MNTDDRRSPLEAWDALTRDARPPVRRRATRPRIRPPVGALMLGAIGLVGLALLQFRPVEPPVTGVDVTPGPTDGHSPGPMSTDALVPIERRLLQFNDVTLAENRRSVRLDFTGAAPGGTFDPNALCSVGYEATAKVVGEELLIGLYALRGHPPAMSGSPLACTQVGYSRSLDVSLDEPFAGHVVRDLAGQTFWLVPPSWLGVIGGLPEDWKLREEGNVRGIPTPRWERVWSPVRNPDPIQGHPMITLIQSHGGPVSVDGGSRKVAVEVNGAPATLSIDPYPFGAELLLVWSVGEDEFALVGYDHDFASRELIGLAELVTVAVSSDTPR